MMERYRKQSAGFSLPAGRFVAMKFEPIKKGDQ
jgi:hypothetical protein